MPETATTPDRATTQARPAASRHYLQLDGLRGLAAIAVIVQHTTTFDAWTHLPIGFAGVWLFFVLSG